MLLPSICNGHGASSTYGQAGVQIAKCSVKEYQRVATVFVCILYDLGISSNFYLDL